MNPNVKYGLLSNDDVLTQVRQLQQMYPLIGDVDHGEDVHGQGRRLCGKSLPFSKVCCEPQAALKIKSIHKK